MREDADLRQGERRRKPSQQPHDSELLGSARGHDHHQKENAVTAANAIAKSSVGSVRPPERSVPNHAAASATTATGSSTDATRRCIRLESKRAPTPPRATSSAPATNHGHGDGPDAYHSEPTSVVRRPSTTSGIDQLATARACVEGSRTIGTGRNRPSCQASSCPRLTRRHVTPRDETVSAALMTRALDAVGDARLASTPVAEKRRNGSPSRPMTTSTRRGATRNSRRRSPSSTRAWTPGAGGRKLPTRASKSVDSLPDLKCAAAGAGTARPAVSATSKQPRSRTRVAMRSHPTRVDCT